MSTKTKSTVIICYSFIFDLYIFVYGRAKCATISLECSKVKLLKLNDFDMWP